LHKRAAYRNTKLFSSDSSSFYSFYWSSAFSKQKSIIHLVYLYFKNHRKCWKTDVYHPLWNETCKHVLWQSLANSFWAA